MVSRSGAIKTRSQWDRPCLVKARKQKEKSWAEFENNPTNTNLSIALHQQGVFERKQQQAMIKFEHVAASHLRNNPKAFYSYIHELKT